MPISQNDIDPTWQDGINITDTFDVWRKKTNGHIANYNPIISNENILDNTIQSIKLAFPAPSWDTNGTVTTNGTIGAFIVKGGFTSGASSTINVGSAPVSTPALNITSSTQHLRFNPNSTAGSFNPLVGAGDYSIIAGSSTSDTQKIIIGKWTNNQHGIVISRDKVGINKVATTNALEVSGAISASGNITAATPTLSSHLTTKGYVDNTFTTPATTTQQGVIELATNAEVQAGTDTTRAITPAGLNACTATQTRTGVIAIASSAEVRAGTDTAKAVTANALNNCTATESRRGVIELATNLEAIGGSDTSRAITPALLASVLGEYGMPTAISYPSGGDLNDIVKSGFYRGVSTSINIPSEASGTDFDLIHIQASNGDASQMLIATSKLIFIRVKDDGRNWGAWERFVFSTQVASATVQGIVELATNAEVLAGTDTTRAITPAGLKACTATQTRTGVIAIASSVEVQEGTDTAKAVTANALNNCTATESRRGVIELATQTQVNNGISQTRAVTPATLKTYVGRRAWVVFNGTSGDIFSAYNVNSVKRSGGVYTINIAAGVFSNGNYAVSGLAGDLDHIVGYLTSTANQLVICTVDTGTNDNNETAFTEGKVMVMMIDI
jgi:hypothetical protein